MRAFFIRSSIITGLIVLLLATSGVALAVYAPYHPGSVLFPLQNFAEWQLRDIYRDPVSNSNYLLDLVERRVDDLKIRSGTKYEQLSLEYLDNSIDQATLAISSVPQEKSDKLRLRLLSLAQRADEEIKQLTHVPIENHTGYIAFQSKLYALTHMVTTMDVPSSEHSPAPANPSINRVNSKSAILLAYSASGLIPFPPGSQGAIHAFYPLVGQHISLTCTSCHNSGKYISTSKQCIICHLLKEPVPHYNGECELCHTPVSWTDVHFDHSSAAAKDCSSCHDRDKPANHYNGQCSACHVIQAWNLVTFDHAVAGAVDCVSCHGKVTPNNHYPGQCSNCHNTSNWTSVVFNHTGFTDCISCHADATPPNHYSGQCSNCHGTSGSWANASFNHSGFTDCISCHAGDAPGNHYSGQCSNCHDPNSSWRNARFNHSGYTDCIACHGGDAPGSHYSGQCSNCHDPNSSWANAHFNHGGNSDCAACHGGNAPANHYPGQCSNCHSTDSWSGAVFNHNGYTDCISCHLNDRPGEHDTGQCSNCHNTQGWGDGGGSGDLGFIGIGTLLSVNCSACHLSNIVAIGIGIKQ
jgi:predicted CXXCH cytochrome family protein